MQKWEYIVTESWRGRKSVIAGGGATDWKSNTNFNQLGNEGWELVAALPMSDIPGEIDAGFTTRVEFIFKRPIA